MKTKLFFLICTILIVGLTVNGVRADLIGHWPLDEGQGIITLDATGNGNDGTLRGNPQWVPGVFKSGLHFDADDDVDCGNDARLDITGPISIAIWINPDKDESANIAPLCKATSGAGGWSWQLRYGWSSPQPDMGFQFNGTGGRVWVYANQLLTVGEWYHFAAAHDGSVVKCYVNGVETDSEPMTSIAGGASPLYIGQDGWDDNWEGALDDVRIYDHGLSPEEVVAVVKGSPPGLSSSPFPEHEAVDVVHDVSLDWSAGEFATAHTVFLGTVADDVLNATVDAPLDVLASQAQDTTTYDAGRLAYSQTYYWRVDEVNGAPDKTVFQGEVWSFTVEPKAIPITHITATASGAAANMGPERTIDGSGLDEFDQHNTTPTDMWLTGDTDAWIQFDFDKAYKLHEMLVWNSNQVVEAFIGFGTKEIAIETSTDGTTWTALADVTPLARANGLEGYAANTTVDFGGIMAKYGKMTVISAHGMTGQVGLSEVRFLTIPTYARELMPADGGVTEGVEVALTWRAGREAAAHEVYLGTDPANLALVGTPADNAFVTDPLNYIQTYYWQIVEVNEAETPARSTGDIQSFTTPDYGTVDDFEAYSGDEGQEVFLTWLDGFGGDTALGGSTTGHIGAPFVETAIVYDGGKSLPIFYANDGSFVDIDGKVSSPGFSEVVRAFDSPQDWTAGSIKTLSLVFRGESGNAGQLYIKINGTKIAYDGSPADITQAMWHVWNIDLTSVNVQSVRDLAIGVEGAGTKGMLYVDALRLYPKTGEVITPVMPDAANLMVYLPLDGDYRDASGNMRHSTAVGNPLFVPGALGQAPEFDGGDDYINIDGYQGINADLTDPANPVQQPFTISNWVKTDSATGDTEMVTWGATSGSATRLTWRVHEGRVRTEHNAGNLRGDTYVNDNEWHHVALVVTEGANLRPETTQLYVDGLEDSTFSGADVTYKLVAEHDVRIGMSGPQDGRYFPGSLDEVRIYDRALSAAEIAGLAGRTAPIHKSF